MSKRPRRRVVYHEEPAAQPSLFSIDRLLSLTATPVIAAIIALVGFYFTTNATIQQQAEAIKLLTQQAEKTNVKIETVSKSVTDKTDNDNTQREKIRESFLAAQTKTSDGIAKLDTRLAVAENQQAVANTQLQKISETLDRISGSFAPAAASRRR